LRERLIEVVGAVRGETDWRRAGHGQIAT